MLEIYLSHRPLAGDVVLDQFATMLDGYSGADIKYLCDRAATIPFLRSIASGVEGEITAAIFQDTIHDTPRSVTVEMLRKFDQWAGDAAKG
jgi:transitional endoplasmic reticulum ATPase